ncbi:hypothetical protein A4G19_14125 [Pasteurellaceae bacterium Macca]|nr:hypothetical protein [Pasteurellaceae bacterium Macca]MCK3656024.1 hypothetical protein [Pasteurellaceae bacterium Macca]MCK3656039.1 hypothetical protein [Pasteurellaceae bacterium Macca]MCK3656071.1 hypothetical protein [Pasteurellaceae bacterium Macca]MCK3656455.1 hypothetical protein [Pasteurellaceae bacterium Macca]
MRNSTQPQAEHLNEASKAFWQAYSLLQMTANGIQSNSDPHTIISALNGISALMNEGLNHLGEL